MMSNAWVIQDGVHKMVAIHCFLARADFRVAVMAAVLPNPERYSVTAPSLKVRERARWIARQARNLGAEFMPRLEEGDLLVEAQRLPSATLEGSIEMSTQIENILKGETTDLAS